MTISTTQSAQTFLGNASTSSFSYTFVMGVASNAVVYYTNPSGVQLQLSPSQYILTINAPTGSQTFGVGGTITYPTSGSPIPFNSQLTVSRLLPLVQNTTISNQGNFDPQVIESALDTLCQQIQQVSARTGQFRGVWATGTVYSFGDIIQDGLNGSNTLNFYLCVTGNTSTTWSNDLANGDWQIILNVSSIVGPSGVAGGDLTGNYPSPVIAPKAVTYAKFQDVPAQSVLVGGATIGALTPITLATQSFLGRAAGNITGLTTQQSKAVLNLQPQSSPFLSTGTFTTSANITTSTLFKVTILGGGGGGGGTISNLFAAAGGGGAGGAAIKYISGLSPSTGYAVTIGAAGVGGVGNNPGTGGTGSQIVIGATTISVSGGSGGGAGAQTGSAYGFGGGGGAPSNTYDIGMFGGAGMPGISVASGQALGGAGGSSFFGAGGNFSAASNGSNGGSFGSGGSGAGGNASGTKNGGNGAPGYCLIEWVE